MSCSSMSKSQILSSQQQQQITKAFSQTQECILSLCKNQGGRGHWTVYYISPQSLIMMFSYSLGTFVKF